MTADLIEKYLHGSLTSAEAAALAQAMAENPALADEFAAATRMESDLGGAFKEDARTALYTRRMQRAEQESEAAAPPRRWWRPAAAAAGLALLSGAGWAWLNTAQKSIAQKKPSPGTGSGTLATSGTAAANSDAWRSGGAAAVKRKLQKFIASNGGSAAIRSLPVSQALAELEGQWKNYAHRDPADKAALSFAIAATARQLWPKAEDEPKVSLEIPGISLLTSVEVIAAQSGLQAKVTDTGVTLEPDSRQDDGKPRTWTLPLAATTFDAFLTRARAGHAGPHAQSGLTTTVNNVKFWDAGFSTPSQSAVMTWGRFISPVNSALTTWEVQDPNSANGDPVLLGKPLLTFTENGQDSDGAVALSEDLVRHSAAQDSFIPPPGPPDTVIRNNTAVQMGRVQEGVTVSATTSAPPPVPWQDAVTFQIPSQVAHTNWSYFGSTAMDYGVTVPAEPPAAIFSRLLAAHGVSGAEIGWDSENGSVTARGTLPELRAAGAALAAVQESSSAAATIRASVLEWPDGTAPPLERESGILTATEAAALTKQAGTALALPATTAAMDVSTRIGVSVESTPSLASGLLPTAALSRVKGGTLVEGITVTAQGFTLRLSTRVTHADDLTVRSATDSTAAQTDGVAVRDVNVTLAEGECYRCDFPAHAGGKAATVLLRVQPTTITR